MQAHAPRLLLANRQLLRRIGEVAQRGILGHASAQVVPEGDEMSSGLLRIAGAAHRVVQLEGLVAVLGRVELRGSLRAPLEPGVEQGQGLAQV